MCIVVFMWQAHPMYPFFLLLNRDEYHNRPTKPLGWWEGGEILGGKDEVAGGTWLASSKDGKIAFLTNVLELHTLPEAKSRGDLAIRFLESKKSPKAFADDLVKEANQYNGFNLILADLESKSMVYVSNRPKSEPASVQQVSPGIHVLSNAKLNTPWPKVQRLGINFKSQLAKCGGGEIPVKKFVENLMRDKVKADESQLPHICSIDWELGLSSIFVEVATPLGTYGTRSISTLTVTSNGEASFCETHLDKDSWKENSFNYSIENVSLNHLA